MLFYFMGIAGVQDKPSCALFPRSPLVAGEKLQHVRRLNPKLLQSGETSTLFCHILDHLGSLW